MFAVNVSRRYRTGVPVSVTVAVLPLDGSKVYPVGAFSELYAELSVLPVTPIVWVRVAQAAAGGSLSTSRLSALAAPRSTVTDCGNALLRLSQ